MNEILFVNRASIRVLLLKITRHGQQRERQTMLAGECFICLDSIFTHASIFITYLHVLACLRLFFVYCRYPPGHGDVFPALNNCGQLDELIAQVFCFTLKWL